MRLDKFVSSQLTLSRTEVKKLAKQGQIEISGIVEKNTAVQIDPMVDVVSVNGKQIAYKQFIYIMLNKPQGVVSATEDAKQKTVIDLVPSSLYRDGLFPAGRLDGDTEGFVLVTDDGGFAHKILSPKSHVEKTYVAVLADSISNDDILLLQAGVTLKDGYECLPAKIRLIDFDSNTVEIKICEGKYHQIKRMFAACGNKVVSLKRVKIGDLSLDESLKPGDCREISAKELELIYKID